MSVIPVLRVSPLAQRRAQGSGLAVIGLHHYVSTTGGTGVGTITDPWSLAYALGSGAGSAQGDGKLSLGANVWLRDGLYQNATAFNCNTTGILAGGVDDPTGKIKFRNFPGEFVEIESTNTGDVESLRINGSYTWWWGTWGQAEGLVVKRSWAENPRTSARGSPIWIKDAPQDGNKVIHVVVHDGDSGIYMGNSAGNDFRYGDIELYGPITYNCGHAPFVHHNYYLRHTPPGLMTVEGAIGFNTCNMGMQIYSQDGTGGLQGIRVKKCVEFGAGILGDRTNVTINFVIINGIPGVFLQDFVLEDFISYHDAEGTGNRRPLSIGGSVVDQVPNEDTEVARGYLVGGSLGVRTGVFRVDAGPSLNYHDNEYYPQAAVQVLQQDQSGSLANYTGWATNQWRRDTTATAWSNGGTSRNFANWKTSTGLGASDTAPAADPTVNEVFVFPLTKYNPGYGHVVCFNWENGANVNVDLSTILSVGDGYRVWNVQSGFPLPAPLLSGTYAGGTVAFPMPGVTPPTPVGVLPNSAPTTGPLFDVFLVRRV